MKVSVIMKTTLNLHTLIVVKDNHMKTGKTVKATDGYPYRWDSHLIF